VVPTAYLRLQLQDFLSQITVETAKKAAYFCYEYLIAFSPLATHGHIC
jgi:hypothetical protein